MWLARDSTLLHLTAIHPYHLGMTGGPPYNPDDLRGVSFSQLAGSQADGPVLLQQPAITLLRKAKQKRGRRLETVYLVSFEG